MFHGLSASSSPLLELKPICILQGVCYVFDLIIKNGTVILENEARVVDIAVKGGKIAAIGQDLGDAKEVMDASGLVVSPGMVDAHTHISEPGRSHWEGYETGTRAAAKVVSPP